MLVASPRAPLPGTMNVRTVKSNATGTHTGTTWARNKPNALHDRPEYDKERAGDQEGEQVRLVVVGRLDDRAADAPLQAGIRCVEVRRGPACDPRRLHGDADPHQGTAHGRPDTAAGPDQHHRRDRLQRDVDDPHHGESAQQAPPQLPVGRDVGVGVGLATSCRLRPQESTDSSGDSGGAEHDGNQQSFARRWTRRLPAPWPAPWPVPWPVQWRSWLSPPRRYGLSLNDLDELVAARPVGQWRSPAALVDSASERLCRLQRCGSAVIIEVAACVWRDAWLGLHGVRDQVGGERRAQVDVLALPAPAPSRRRWRCGRPPTA